MAEVTGYQRVIDGLAQRRQLAAADARLKLIVGYKAEYAVYVHENLQANHPIGRAKFLEEPQRTEQPTMLNIIATDLGAGKTWRQALLRAGLHLQRTSQKLTPLDTGFLRNSAYTDVS